MGHRPGEFERGVNRGGLAANCDPRFVRRLFCSARGSRKLPWAEVLRASPVQGCGSPAQELCAGAARADAERHRRCKAAQAPCKGSAQVISGTWIKSTHLYQDGVGPHPRGSRAAGSCSCVGSVGLHQYPGLALFGFTSILAELRWDAPESWPRSVGGTSIEGPVRLH